MKQYKLSITLALISIGIIVVWAWGYLNSTTAIASPPWEIYNNSLYLSGLLSIALMSASMMLATRPAWLEIPFNGLDQMYLFHKWIGILAVMFAALHWLIEMGDDVVKSLFGHAGRLHDQDFSGFVDMMRDAAEDIGEWAVYLVFAMLALTLWKRFPYNIWRYVHRAMPVLYLLLVFHALWLAPLIWWQQPVGLFMALLLAGGSFASFLSLSGKIGLTRKVKGTIHSISTEATDVTEVECQLEQKWQGHQAGQFAFVTFDRLEGAHPFTIASADQSKNRVTFQIKALGDYTKRLAYTLKIGQSVIVEGPYGRFDFKQRKANATQIWIAGGIGITPFLAKLEELKNNPEQAPKVQMHYSTHDCATDPFVNYLQKACLSLSNIQLHIHDSNEGKKLTADELLSQGSRKGSKKEAMEVWFCGPSRWAKTLEKELRQKRQGSLLFHKEAFELR